MKYILYVLFKRLKTYGNSYVLGVQKSVCM